MRARRGLHRVVRGGVVIRVTRPGSDAAAWAVVATMTGGAVSAMVGADGDSWLLVIVGCALLAAGIVGAWVLAVGGWR